jgi:hypothetical protein
MQNDLYMLIELIKDIEGMGPMMTSRIVAVAKNSKGMTILKSEYDYLGSEPIKVELDEEDEGVNFFSFTSKDDDPRTFMSDDAESSEYVEGDIIQNDEELGECIFRKISDVDWV